MYFSTNIHACIEGPFFRTKSMNKIYSFSTDATKQTTVSWKKKLVSCICSPKQFPRGQFLIIGRFENAFTRPVNSKNGVIFGSFLKASRQGSIRINQDVTRIAQFHCIQEQNLCLVHVVVKNLISILVTDYIQKRRGQALLFSFEYILLF